MKRSIELAIVALAFAFWSFLGVAQAADLKTVSLQANPSHIKDESPDAGFLYRKFQNPGVSDATDERVTFFATTKSDGISPAITKNCIFKVKDDGTGDVVACKKDSAPGGGKYVDFRDYSINTSGVMAWASNLTGGKSGVFKGDPDIVSLLGDAVPGGGLLKSFSKTAMNDSGDVVYLGGISGVSSSVDQAIFRCPSGSDCNATPGDLQKLVQKNDLHAGRRFCGFSALAASDYGIAFRASTKVNCSDAGESSKVGIFRKQFGGAIETVALESDASEPFTGGGGTKYDDFTGSPSIENDGIVAFSATTKGLLSKENLYLCDPAACPAAPAEAVVQAGDADACGRDFVNFSAPVLSDAGDMTFSARSTRGVRGVYIHRFATDALEAVACKGDSVPGVSGTEFKSFGQPAMSTGGKVTFKGAIKQTSPPKKNFEGIFLFE